MHELGKAASSVQGTISSASDGPDATDADPLASTPDDRKLGPGAKVVRRLFDAIRTGDLRTLRAVVDGSAVWHVPPMDGIGGDHRGHGGILGFATSLAQRTGGSYTLDLADVAEGGTHIVAIHHTRGGADDRRLDQLECTMFRVQNGAVVEAWGPLSTDPDQAAAFWGAST
jgi:ketosteroid isomerase-like protein